MCTIVRCLSVCLRLCACIQVINRRAVSIGGFLFICSHFSFHNSAFYFVL